MSKPVRSAISFRTMGFQMRFIPVHEVVVLIVDYRLHRAVQCIVPLLYGFDEPLWPNPASSSRIAAASLFSLSEELAASISMSGILAVHLQLGYRKARHGQLQLPVLEGEHEVRNYLLRLFHCMNRLSVLPEQDSVSLSWLSRPSVRPPRCPCG